MHIKCTNPNTRYNFFADCLKTHPKIQKQTPFLRFYMYNVRRFEIGLCFCVSNIKILYFHIHKLNAFPDKSTVILIEFWNAFSIWKRALMPSEANLFSDKSKNVKLYMWLMSTIQVDILLLLALIYIKLLEFFKSSLCSDDILLKDISKTSNNKCLKDFSFLIFFQVSTKIIVWNIEGLRWKYYFWINGNRNCWICQVIQCDCVWPK